MYNFMVDSQDVTASTIRKCACVCEWVCRRWCSRSLTYSSQNWIISNWYLFLHLDVFAHNLHVRAFGEHCLYRHNGHWTPIYPMVVSHFRYDLLHSTVCVTMVALSDNGPHVRESMFWRCRSTALVTHHECNWMQSHLFNVMHPKWTVNGAFNEQMKRLIDVSGINLIGRWSQHWNLKANCIESITSILIIIYLARSRIYEFRSI